MNAVAPWADSRDETQLKKAFALALLETSGQPYEAARKVFKSFTDGQRALHASNHWVNDPVVLTEQTRLIEDLGEEYFLPTKVMTARAIYALGELVTASVGERLAAFRLYSEIRKFLPKDNVAAVNVNIQQNRVMVMKDHGTDEEWEAKAAAHQMKAIEHSRD